MDKGYEQAHQIRALAMRVAALEENVAFLEQWCEEQQDLLDRSMGPVGYDYEVAGDPIAPPRTVLRVVDLRDVRPAGPDEEDDVAADAIVAFVDTEHDRRVRQLRSQLNRLRSRLAASLAPPPDLPAERRPVPPAGAPRAKTSQKLSAKPAGRTAP